MLKRDYILRLIQEFAEALALLKRKDTGRQKDELKKMYDQYVGPYTFYHTGTIDEVMTSFGRYPQQERAERMEMLAELYYTEAGLTPVAGGTELLRKALALFDFIDRHDKTYSMVRQAKMAEIKKRVEEADADSPSTR